MLQGTKNLTDSKKGTVAVVLAAIITILIAIGFLDPEVGAGCLAALGMGHNVGQGLSEFGKGSSKQPTSPSP